MTYKMILVGTGGQGRYWCSHYLPPNIKEGLLEVVAAVDTNPEALENARKFLGLPADRCYTDIQKAFRENCADFCTIVVPPAFHEPVVDVALEHDMHILSEKPIADTWAGSLRIANKVKCAGKKMGVTMSHRFDQDKTTLRQELKSGRYGALDYLVCRFTCNWRKFGSWGKFRHEIPNPLMVEGAVHHLDILADLAGARCDTIYAQTWNPPWGEYAGDSQGLVMMHFENGTRALYEGAKTNSVSLNPWGQEYIRAECEKATLILSHRRLECFAYNACKQMVKEGDGETIPLLTQSKWSNTWLVEKFVRWLSGGEPMETNVADNLQSVALIFAAIESNQTGQPVRVQDFLSGLMKLGTKHYGGGRTMSCPEKRTHRDFYSGVEVTQMTDYRGHSHHFYFTNPGWYGGGTKLLFSSDRANRTNLFGVDLTTGEIEQLTDLEPVPLPREVEFFSACKNPLREEVYFCHDLSILALNLVTKRIRTLYEIDPKWHFEMTNCSSDGRFVYFGIWEDLSSRFAVGYGGFAEIWAAKPLSRIMQVGTDGNGGKTIFEERYWIGHVNTSPTRPELLTFCHEGPWDKVDNRIWGLEVSTGRAWKIRPTSGREVVGHEYWYADGQRIGYHGCDSEGKPIFGRVRYNGTEQYEAHFAGVTGHIFSNDETLVVGDGGGVIRLWRWDGNGYAGPRILCDHYSTMRIQQTHPHPRISPDGQYVVFTSDKSGYGNVYMVRLVDFGSLPPANE